MKSAILVLVCLGASAASAQESALAADFRGEGTRFKESCGSFKIGPCAELLFTDHPLHLAVGSLAPQNGFGVGPAFVTHWTPNETWRINLDMDAVATSNQSWRAGAYLTAVLIRRPKIVPVPGGSASAKKKTVAIEEQPVFHAYAQSTSLNKLNFFGLGPSTHDTARAFYGMRETIAGGNVVYPLIKGLNLSLVGEANGRFVDLRGDPGQTSPSIEQIYTNATAPGLAKQPGFAQFGEGVRVRPSLIGDHLRLNYFVGYQQYIAGDSTYSFQRFTADLSHQIPLYGTTRSLLPLDFNGPDDCSTDASVHKCPSISRNLEGSINLQFLVTESYTGAGHVVPFYFQPTLGGSDINGVSSLPSYQDYRFRGPNLMLLHGDIEHSLPGRFSALGMILMAETGKVALTHSDLDFSHMAHSYAAGLTLRAGGFPQIKLLFAFGGHEGHHTIAAVDTSLLGGSPRPIM